MNQLNYKLEESSGKRNTEVLLKFMGMAVLGVVESFVLDQFHGGVEEIAAQVGELLEQIITSPQMRNNRIFTLGKFGFIILIACGAFVALLCLR